MESVSEGLRRRATPNERGGRLVVLNRMLNAQSKYDTNMIMATGHYAHPMIPTEPRLNLHDFGVK